MINLYKKAILNLLKASEILDKNNFSFASSETLKLVNNINLYSYAADADNTNNFNAEMGEALQAATYAFKLLKNFNKLNNDINESFSKIDYLNNYLKNRKAGNNVLNTKDDDIDQYRIWLLKMQGDLTSTLVNLKSDTSFPRDELSNLDGLIKKLNDNISLIEKKLKTIQSTTSSALTDPNKPPVAPAKETFDWKAYYKWRNPLQKKLKTSDIEAMQTFLGLDVVDGEWGRGTQKEIDNYKRNVLRNPNATDLVAYNEIMKKIKSSRPTEVETPTETAKTEGESEESVISLSNNQKIRLGIVAKQMSDWMNQIPDSIRLDYQKAYKLLSAALKANKNKTLNLPMMDRAEAALRNFIEKAKRLPTLASRISQFDAQLSQIEEFERFK